MVDMVDNEEMDNDNEDSIGNGARSNDAPWRPRDGLRHSRPVADRE